MDGDTKGTQDDNITDRDVAFCQLILKLAAEAESDWEQAKAMAESNPQDPHSNDASLSP